MKLTDYKVLTFDCYGTLIDWESGIVAGLQPLSSRLETPLSRDVILEAHARHESSQQRMTPGKRYSELLAIVYKRLSEEWGIASNWQACIDYGNSVPQWPAFPDSAEALQYLSKHYKLVVLSNVDNVSFAGSQVRLKTEFDAVYTAEDAGSYKPDDNNFHYMLEHLTASGIDKADILHTAESMFHDHVPANRHGLDSCWIYRRFEKKGFGATMDPGTVPNYRFRFNSMMELVKAHQEELRV